MREATSKHLSPDGTGPLPAQPPKTHSRDSCELRSGASMLAVCPLRLPGGLPPATFSGPHRPLCWTYFHRESKQATLLKPPQREILGQS